MAKKITDIFKSVRGFRSLSCIIQGVFRLSIKADRFFPCYRFLRENKYSKKLSNRFTSCRLLIVTGERFIFANASITFSIFLHSIAFCARYNDFFSGISATSRSILLLNLSSLISAQIISSALLFL